MLRAQHQVAGACARCDRRINAVAARPAQTVARGRRGQLCVYAASNSSSQDAGHHSKQQQVIGVDPNPPPTAKTGPSVPMLALGAAAVAVAVAVFKRFRSRCVRCVAVRWGYREQAAASEDWFRAYYIPLLSCNAWKA
jgi:hypothetical protein